MYRYTNQIFIGDLCNSQLISTPIGDYDPIYWKEDIFSGISSSVSTGYCYGITFGSISGFLSSKNYFSSVNTGSLRLSSQSNSLSGILTGSSSVSCSQYRQSGYYNGAITLDGFSGVMELQINSANASFNITGEVYGFGESDSIYGSHSVSYIGDTWSAISGYSDGYIEGSGFYFLEGSGAFAISGVTSIYGSGLNTSIFVGESSIYNSSDSSTDIISSGAIYLERSGIWTSKMSGYSSGSCLSDRTDFKKQGCGKFPPFRTSCESRGNLNVKISSPQDGTIFNIPVIPPRTGSAVVGNTVLGKDVIPTGVVFIGGLISGLEDPTDGDIDSDGDDDDNTIYYCPYSDVVPSSCYYPNGKVTFNTLNTNYSKCGLVPPYSGWVGYKADYRDTDEASIFMAVGTSSSPFPENLTFSNLKPGLYTLHLSGSSGYTDITANVYPTGMAYISSELLQKTSSCSGSDAVVRFKWKTELDYELLDTNYRGKSATGFIATGLSSRQYICKTYETSWCKAESYITPESSAEPIIDFSIKGISCSGSGNDGSAKISVIGSNPPYDILWKAPIGVSGYHGTSKDSLGTGLYSLTITDVNGCAYDSNFYVDVDKKDLGVYTNFADGSYDRTVCCQLGAEPGIKPNTLYAYGYGGVKPYTYTWYQDSRPFHTGQYVYGVPGNYEVRVTDSAGCSAYSYSDTISSTNRCLKIKWTSSSIHNTNYQEHIDIVKPSELPISFPFKYSVPGIYIVTLAISDGYGRSGIDCIKIKVNGYYNIIDRPIEDPNGDDGIDDGDNDSPVIIVPPNPETPDEIDDGGGDNDSGFIFIGGGGNGQDFEDPVPPPNIPPGPPAQPDPGGDQPDSEGGGGGETDEPNESQICCGLLSSGTDDVVCRTHCFTDASMCKDRNPSRYKTAAKCEDCQNIWTPRVGACCVCKFVDTPEGGYEDCQCNHISSCDPESACNKLVFQAGGEAAGYYTHGFSEGKDCLIDGGNYACPAGICCKGVVPEGVIGPVGENNTSCGDTCVGYMSEKACMKDKGYIISYTAKTCEEAGAIEWNDQKYCKFNSAVCCIKASPVDSNTQCGCFCDEGSTCKECSEQLAAMVASDPLFKCNYSGGASPYVNLLDSKTCQQLSCGCSNSTSSGVVGPL